MNNPHYLILGWPKSFLSFQNILRKNPNEFLANPTLGSLFTVHFILLIYFTFIFGCTGSLLLNSSFQRYGEWGQLLSSCGAWAFHCGGFSCCGAWA